MAQHADLDQDFQQHALSLMRDLPESEVNPRNVAYLEDRVRVGQGRPQFYGTQGKIECGIVKAFPIEDKAGVDRRRAALGMSTVALQ